MRKNPFFPGAAILFCGGLTFAQNTGRPTQVITPEQKRYQTEFSKWRTSRAEYRKQAQSALNAEAARESASECPNAQTTRAQEECLASERQKTQSNYDAFTKALRALLALASPAMPGGRSVDGPTGRPLTAEEEVKEFDGLEAQSKAYRGAASKVAYNRYRGGTLAPVFALEAELKLLRLHLKEMAFIYGEELANH